MRGPPGSVPSPETVTHLLRFAPDVAAATPPHDAPNGVACRLHLLTSPVTPTTRPR
jgi:hypothetical protein